MARSSLSGVPVLVTGGAGFIGSHLVDALLEAGARVRVLDNLSTGLSTNLEPCRSDIEFIEGDLRDEGSVHKACHGRQIVFHQAALGSVPRSMKDPATTIAVNVGGTANVFTAARDAGADRVVYASSSSVYGDSTRLPKVEGEEGRPMSPYALSKSMNEELAATFSRCFNLPSVGLRYFNVYGPRQRPDGPYAAVIPRFFEAAIEGRAPIIFGDGEQSRDFTFVADAVQANLLAATAPEAKEPAAVNVACAARVTVNELAREVLSRLGSEVEPVHEPPRPGDVRDSLADLTEASKLLGYEPSVGLAAGLEATVKHFRKVTRTG